MTSTQHRNWINNGKPFTLARPLATLRDRLRRYGYTVYDIGNNNHLDHQPPEDHTPYSATGWPIPTPYGWGTAIDIMPDGNVPFSLQALGAQIFADVQAGRAGFVKYMNWGPTSNRSAVQDYWQPNHGRKNSSDTGHTHISCRSDVVTSSSWDNYDPVAALLGRPSFTLETGMNIIGTPDGARYLQTVTGPVAITWDEWVASFGEDHNGWPPVLIVRDEDRVNEFCPVVGAGGSVDIAQNVPVTGTLHIGK